MPLPRLPLRSSWLRPAILLCFFVSGACGLIYQIAWLRVMGLVFGNTTLATCTVLAGFMAGLGLGALYFGRWIDLRGRAVLIYGLLELGVGLYAFFTPGLWKIMEWGYVGFYRAFQPGPLAFSVFRFALAFLLLLTPTFLMGGTLPVMTKHFVSQSRDTARIVGLLYALNTFCAVLGVYLCGFYMLYTLVVWQKKALAGVLNFLIFYVCYSLSAEPAAHLRPPPAAVPQTAPGLDQAPEAPFGRGTAFLLLILFAVSGGVSMIYEIGWTRVLAVSLGSSVYAFAIMLATFLLGIALGSYFFSLYSVRRPVSLTVFAVLEMLTAVFVFWGLNQFDDLSYSFVRIFVWAGGHSSLLDLGRFSLCAWVMLPPTFCIGALFACFIHVYQHSGRVGADLGKAYFSNTLGTILGSVLTGFILIPVFGIQRTLQAGAWLNAVIGLAAFALASRAFSWKRVCTTALCLLMVTASALAVEPWNKTILSSDTAINPSRVKDLSRREFVRSLHERELVFYQEGTSATVSVTRLRDDLSLAVNGKTDASTSDAFTQFLLGHLPLMLKPDAARVLVIGLGSGSTLAAVASHPVKVIEAVEIESSVIRAAHLFKILNRDVLNDPRVRIFNNDGRNFLLVNPNRYDVIISEPSNPWMAGVANLFSLEHYQTMRKRLNPGGVVCQWLHAYSMSPRDLQMIIKTFAQVFPETSLWTSYYPDLMLIGADEPLTIDFQSLKKTFQRPHVADDFRPYGIATPEAFLSNYWLGTKEISRLTEDGRTNRDNVPILEFSAPRYLYRHTLTQNFHFLNTYRTMQFPPVTNLEPPLEKNAGFYFELMRGYIAKRFTLEALWAADQARKIEPDSARMALADGIIRFQSRQLPPAQEFFKKAVSMDPGNAEAHYYSGLLAKEQKDAAGAYLHFHKALQLDPGNKNYMREYFMAVCLQGDLAEAAAVYSKLKAAGAADFSLISRMAELIFQKAEPKVQEDMARSLIEHYPHFSPAYVKLGGFFEKNGNFWEALKIYKQMSEIMPLEPYPFLSLARVYSQLHKEDKSKQALKKAIQLDPQLKKNPAVRKALQA